MFRSLLCIQIKVKHLENIYCKCDPPRDFREYGERTHTARSHSKEKELAFNTLAAC